MDDQNFKTCRYCSEKIAAGARVCPRCGQWLSIFSLKNPTVMGVMICIWAALSVYAFNLVLRKNFNPGIDFSAYRNQISVTESHMIFGTNYENEPIVSIVAMVTNQTDLAWKQIPLEVRFFDKTGRLIDVGERDYFDTLYPKSDGAIRINTEALRPLTDYASYKIYVGGARDAHSRF
jgi:hypothetical protein